MIDHYDDCPFWACPTCGVEWDFGGVGRDAVGCSCTPGERDHTLWECKRCGMYLADGCTDLSQWRSPNAWPHFRRAWHDGVLSAAVMCATPYAWFLVRRHEKRTGRWLTRDEFWWM